MLHYFFPKLLIVEGRTITLDVEPASTIENIKTKINRQLVEELHRVQECSLAFAGKKLLAGMSIESYGIRKESTLHITFVRGGGIKRQRTTIESNLNLSLEEDSLDGISSYKRRKCSP